MSKRKLTVKQKKFADEYIISGNATEAAKKAGYSKNTASETGYENLNKPHIKNYIDKKMAEIEEDSIAEAKEVLAYLTSVMRGEETEEVLCMIDKGMQGKTDIAVGAKDRLKAAELLGKRYSLFTDRVDLDSDITLIFEDDYGDQDEED